MTSIKSEVATLVVLRSDIATEVASVAREHVALDTPRRRVLVPGDAAYPSDAQIQTWDLPTEAAVVVLTPDGRLSSVLDPERATSGAWIEDAFVRALRERDHYC